MAELFAICRRFCWCPSQMPLHPIYQLGVPISQLLPASLLNVCTWNLQRSAVEHWSHLLAWRARSPCSLHPSHPHATFSQGLAQLLCHRNKQNFPFLILLFHFLPSFLTGLFWEYFLRIIHILVLTLDVILPLTFWVYFSLSCMTNLFSTPFIFM